MTFLDSNQAIIEQITDRFEGSTSTLRGLVPNFYSYNYDGGNLNIGDGGNDMYDTGNRVSRFCLDVLLFFDSFSHELPLCGCGVVCGLFVLQRGSLQFAKMQSLM